MTTVGLLLVALAGATPTATPLPPPPPAPAATPWGRRPPPPPAKVLDLGRDEVHPPVGSLSDVAAGVKLKSRSISNRPDPGAGVFVASTPGVVKRSDAEYLKDVAAYKEGDGVAVYIILAAKDGHQVSSDGYLTVSVRASGTYAYYGGQLSYDRQVYWRGDMVSESSFTTSTVGVGAFAHEALILSLGRITWDQLTPFPDFANHLTVSIGFTTADGRQLSGSADLYK
jgi:hypothetical protein